MVGIRLTRSSQLKILIVFDNRANHSASFEFSFVRLLTFLSYFKKGELNIDCIVPRQAVGACLQLENIARIEFLDQTTETIAKDINVLEKSNNVRFESYDFVIVFTLQGTTNFRYPEKLLVFEKAFLSDYPFLPSLCFYKFDQPILLGERARLPQEVAKSQLQQANDAKLKIGKFFSHLEAHVQKQFEPISIEEHLPLALFEHPNFSERIRVNLEQHFTEIAAGIEEKSIITCHRQSKKQLALPDIWAPFQDQLKNIKTAITVSGWCELQYLENLSQLSVHINAIEATVELPFFRLDLQPESLKFRVAWLANVECFMSDLHHLTVSDLSLDVAFGENIVFAGLVQPGEIMHPYQNSQNVIFLESVFFRNDIGVSTYANAVAKSVHLTGSKAAAMPLLHNHERIVSSHSELDVGCGKRAIIQQFNHHTPTRMKEMPFNLDGSLFLNSELAYGAEVFENGGRPWA